MNDDENPLEAVFTYLLYAALLIAPVVIMLSFVSYNETKLITREMNAFIDTVNSEGITSENLNAFLEQLATYGSDIKMEIYVDGEYITHNEIIEKVISSGKYEIKYGELFEVTVTGKHKLYAQRILGQNSG